MKVLSKGLNFSKTPGEPNLHQQYSDLKKFFRRLRLKAFFSDQTNTTLDSHTQSTEQTTHFLNFRTTSAWQPPEVDKTIEGFIEIVTQQFFKTIPRSPKHHNLSKKETEAIKKLKDNPHLIIKKADKGSAVTIMNTVDYVRECLRQLNDTNYYTELDHDPTADYNKLIQTDLEKLRILGFIDQKTLKVLSTKDPRTPTFYILPKIHKTHIPGRPILSANGCPTEKISGFVDSHIRQYVPSTPSYIKDTTHFLQILETIPQPLPPNTLLVTLDVSSLYTNIPHVEAYQAVAAAIRDDTNPPIPSRYVVNLLKHVLEKNCFTINSRYYLQTRGTAVGTRCAPNVANLFMHRFESKALQNYPLKPLIWRRFIDDIFCLWTHGEDELNTFLNYLNNLHPTIKLTCDHSNHSVSFLDTKVILNDGHLTTDLYTKPTDTHNYLHFTSAHPPHCTKHGPYSQLLRIKRICSNHSDFIRHQEALTGYYKKRGYPSRILLENILKVEQITRQQLLHPDNTTTTKQERVILISTYHPTPPRSDKLYLTTGIC